MMNALVAMVPLARTPAWTGTVLEATRKAIQPRGAMAGASNDERHAVTKAS